MAKKPSSVDLVVYMIQRRDIALGNLKKATALGNTGQELFWQSVASEMSQMLAYLTGDEYWAILGNQGAQEFKSKVAVVDAQLKTCRLEHTDTSEPTLLYAA